VEHLDSGALASGKTNELSKHEQTWRNLKPTLNKNNQSEKAIH
jgi:hypothetical protein